MSFRAEAVGRAARSALRAGPATVFAAFERSCYVETTAGIACLGPAALGDGPLNVLIDGFDVPAIGATLSVDIAAARLWRPPSPARPREIPRVEIPASIDGPARALLDWLAGRGEPDDALIGLGPGLTPAGDDFVGGAMIALRAFGTTAGRAALADRIAAWALPLAETNTGKISRAHLRCAAEGEGHAALHQLLVSLSDSPAATRAALAALDRIGHSSGRDAAAGALHALRI